ncbi:methyl-accepting chemotaxis protein [Bdellovibrio sp. HCB2-146]|uniref:methyl-accepting chemotaxis protein n=1 Tax=Bdellovibrio sp. HCB2-146 TaxID=3394362 RepID=UPI0039BC86BD
MASGSWFKSIKGKLFVSAIIPLAGFAAVGYVAFGSLSSMGFMLNDAYVNVIPNMKGLGDIEGSRARIGQYLWGALANKDVPKHRESYVSKARVAVGEFKEAIKEYEAASFQPGEAEMYQPVKNIQAEYIKEVEGFIEVIAVGNPTELEKARADMTEGIYLKHSTEIKKSIGEIVGFYEKIAANKNTTQQAESKKAFIMLAAIGGGAGFVVVAILMYIGQGLSRTVSNVVSRLSDAGQQVNQAIEQLSTAGQGLSQSSTSAAASLEETVASLEEMTSMVKMNSDNAKQAASLSQTSRGAAEDGEREIKNLVASMHDISQSSRKIEEIINVIDDIAFQTNLLALNAAVEAARAGEQGKGFAVVAEAVRSLAQRSAAAAKDITSLIKDSVEKIENGTAIADKSGDVLNNIVTSIKKVADLNNEISAASSEQTTGIQQINKAMNQLDQSSQSNAASSEEIASTAEEIASQSNQMQMMVGDLNAFVTGSSTTAAKESAPSATKNKKAPALAKPKDKEPKAKVIEFKPPSRTQAPSAASDVIPFDDEPRAKVGTTDGF